MSPEAGLVEKDRTVRRRATPMQRGIAVSLARTIDEPGLVEFDAVKWLKPGNIASVLVVHEAAIHRISSVPTETFSLSRINSLARESNPAIPEVPWAFYDYVRKIGVCTDEIMFEVGLRGERDSARHEGNLRNEDYLNYLTYLFIFSITGVDLKGSSDSMLNVPNEDIRKKIRCFLEDPKDREQNIRSISNPMAIRTAIRAKLAKTA